MTEVEMKENKGEHPLGDAGQLVFLGLFLILWVADSFFLRISTFPSHDLPLYIRLVILGLSLVTAGFLYRSGHVAVRDDRPPGVLSHGAFRYVRHPLYLGNVLVYVGLTVSTASLLCLALLAVIFAFYNHIATYEEKLLEIKYGEVYREYKEKTGKWCPKA